MHRDHSEGLGEQTEGALRALLGLIEEARGALSSRELQQLANDLEWWIEVVEADPGRETGLRETWVHLETTSSTLLDETKDGRGSYLGPAEQCVVKETLEELREKIQAELREQPSPKGQ